MNPLQLGAPDTFSRMFAEKSVGMDDPGMVAVVRIIGAGNDRE